MSRFAQQRRNRPSLMRRLRRAVAWAAPALILAALLPAQPVLAAAPAPAPRQAPTEVTAGPIVDVEAQDGNPVRVELAAQGAVGPGGVVALRLSADAGAQAAGVTVSWLLPDGGELLGGPAEELVAGGAPVVSAREVRFPAEGIYRVMAQAAIRPSEAETYAALGVLFFDVRTTGAVVSTRDLTAVHPESVRFPAIVVEYSPDVAPILPTDGIAPDGAPDTGATPALVAEPDDPCFLINGTVTRTERRPDVGGLQAATRVAVANAVVFMREEDTFFDDEYGSRTTDALGNFSFAFCDDDGVFDDDLELYVRLRAELKSGERSVVEVEDSSWIDETYEIDSEIVESDGGTHRIDFPLDENQSAIFNIADAVYQAWSFWNQSGGATGDDAIFDEPAEVHWEPGYNDTISYYSNDWGEMTIADAASDPDQWDDSVIMHEWGHMADDFYGCDDNDGGPHNVDTLVSAELAWGEGYPDYFQSAVRQARGYSAASSYLDVNGAGNININVNFETYDSTRGAALLSDRNELAVAAMLWDLNDGAQDGRTMGGGPAGAPFDRVAHGHPMIQRVYTDPTFESNGDVFDDTCTSWVFLTSWRALSLPTDGATAEAITKNIGRAANPLEPTTGSAVAAAQSGAQGVDPAAVAAAPSGAEDYQWWKRLTFVVDNSASMAGPKFAGVKTVLLEQANDVAQSPVGAQFKLFTFNNSTTAIQPFFKDYFTAGDAATGINALNPSAAADPGCPVYGLSALHQAAQGMLGGQAWLYTDGDGVTSPTANTVKRTLNDRGVRGSVVLLAGCGSAPTPQPAVSETLKSYLGTAANSTQPSGIVPYLLTALGSGGQFLYVNQNQLANTGDVLRAQLSHTAGAGRWSDYVSDSFTYRWDRMDPPDYQWLPIDLMTFAGNLGAPVDVTLPAPFSFYGGARSTARIYEDGYIRLRPCVAGDTVCNILPRGFLNPLKGNLEWAFIPVPPAAIIAGAEQAEAAALVDEGARPAGTDALVTPDAVSAECYGGSNYGLQARAYTASVGINEWYVITFQGEANLGGGSTPCRAFQVWLNLQTGEIQYQYQALNGEAATAEIGLRQEYSLLGSTPDELVVSRNDIAGAALGTGYVFTPAPPQPTKTHTVTVDALMTSVAFLQTGFSGNFEPLVVRDPQGNTISCGDAANVLCLTMDNSAGDRSVQFVQVRVNGRVGAWTAVVDAGSAGQATYSFTGMAESDLEVEGFYDRQAPSFKANKLLVRLGSATDGNTVQAWLQRPDGSRMGAPFTLYDNGLQGDGQAGDGQFGLLNFAPPGRGVAWLWVQGALGGQSFMRMDPAPISLQPFEISLVTPGAVPNDGSPFTVAVRIESHDPRLRCYTPTFELPPGWNVEWEIGEGYPCLNAGQSVVRTITLYPDWSSVSAAAGDAAMATRSGAQAVVGMSMQEQYDDSLADSLEIAVQYFKPAASIVIDEIPLGQYLRPNGADTMPIRVDVRDVDGSPVADGTPVTLAANGGTLAATALATLDGRVTTTFRAPTAPGDYTITAATGALQDTAIVHVRAPIANQVELAASPPTLAGATSATLIATVRDEWGDPVAGAAVRIGVEGDGQAGKLGTAEVVQGVTNAQGQFSTTFVKQPGYISPVGVRAELLGPGGEPVHEARLQLQMSDLRSLFLPLIRK